MTHWKQHMNPDYLGAYALEPGKDKILTIASVGKEMVSGPDGKKEELLVAHFKEDEKPMILNATNCKTISKIHKTPYIEEWVGKKIQIFATPVKAFGEMVEALRVRPKAPESKKRPVTKEDFPKLIEAIKSGDFAIEKAYQVYELSEQQKKKLNEITHANQPG